MNQTYFQQVGNNIQNILTEQGKTQQFLADELEISKQVMSKIINGAKAINIAEISKIANILNVSTDDLLGVAPAKEEAAHTFSFMGKVKNEKTREKIEFLKNVIEELLMLEEYADAE